MKKYLKSISRIIGDFRGRILEKDFYVKSIIIANLAGTLFGFYWYRGLLESTPVYLWPLVPDSPIATLLISTSLFLYLKGNPNKYIDVLAFFGNLKYGLWTVFVELYMFESFLALNSLPMYLFIIFSHAAMFFQAFLVLKYTEFSWKPAVFALSFYLLNDFVDYSLGIYATLPREVSLVSLTSFVAFTLTVSAFLYYSKSLIVEMEIGK